RAQAVDYGLRIVAQEQVGLAYAGWDRLLTRVRFTSPVARDEREQADYLRELIDAMDESAVDAAFVNTFARYDLPHAGADDDRDFDKASFGVVKVLDGGRTGTAYPGLPWEPKAAFHTLAKYGRSRNRPGSGPTAAG
ncbi:hypothetical protein AB0B09_19125, partial [Streptomyces sp. NPDC044948]